MPAHLKKYQTPVEPAAAPSTPVSLLDKATDTNSDEGDQNTGAVDEVPTHLETSSPASPTSRSTITALNANSFRVDLNEDQVWNAIVDILLKNYNLNLVDRSNGLITTEWDSYYLDETLFRNKLTVRINRNGRGGCEIAVHNNIEQAAENPSLNGLWLPANEDHEETHRIIKNLALVLRQPEPVFAPGMVAKRGE